MADMVDDLVFSFHTQGTTPEKYQYNALRTQRTANKNQGKLSLL